MRAAQTGSTLIRLTIDRGATTTEYALLAALITIVIFGAVLAVGDGVLGLFEDANTIPLNN